MQMLRLQLALVTLFSSAGLMSCSGAQPSIATYSSGAPSLLGAPGGKISYVDDCLYLERDGERLLPVFPESEVEYVGEVLTYRGHEYRLGDELELVGGQIDDLARLKGIHIPSSCSKENVWVIAPST